MTIVDKIEGNFAVCETNGAMKDIPLSEIIGNVREGDVLCPNENGTGYTVNAEETQKRRDAMSDRFERLKKQR